MSNRAADPHNEILFARVALTLDALGNFENAANSELCAGDLTLAEIVEEADKLMLAGLGENIGSVARNGQSHALQLNAKIKK